MSQLQIAFAPSLLIGSSIPVLHHTSPQIMIGSPPIHSLIPPILFSLATNMFSMPLVRVKSKLSFIMTLTTIMQFSKMFFIVLRLGQTSSLCLTLPDLVLRSDSLEKNAKFLIPTIISSVLQYYSMDCTNCLAPLWVQKRCTFLSTLEIILRMSNLCMSCEQLPHWLLLIYGMPTWGTSPSIQSWRCPIAEWPRGWMLSGASMTHLPTVMNVKCQAILNWWFPRKHSPILMKFLVTYSPMFVRFRPSHMKGIDTSSPLLMIIHIF